MILTLDFGNTKTKSTVFEKLTIKETTTYNSKENLEKISTILKKHPSIHTIVLSSVLKDDFSKLKNHFPSLQIHIIDRNTNFPYANQYASPKTIGIDRLVLVSAAFYKYPNSNRVIIDAGSCITFDMINANNEYIGGSISPGIEMRYKAIHHFTDNLPLLAPQPNNPLIGNTTKSCIHTGIINGVLSELEQAIINYQKKYSDLTIILTGGDGDFLAKQLKNSIFAHNNLLAEGLAALYYNVISHDKKDHA